MSDDEADSRFSSVDYETIEAAVMETARGRWFLREYAERNRNSDTQAVLKAVDALKDAIFDSGDMGRMKVELQQMASAIRQTKREVRSFPRIDRDDPLNALSDADFQAAAEQRIRRMVQTLHYLEGRINAMVVAWEAGRQPSMPRAGEHEDEGSHHSHPAFLM